MNRKRWNGKGYNRDGNIEFEIKDGNGKTKEYGYWGNMIFEGEYLNGIRNGKGKEYNNDGQLIFEGEYLNGKRLKGTEKEYIYSSILIFEGEYLNGKRWNGKERQYLLGYWKNNI